jgi:hypothetical protein
MSLAIFFENVIFFFAMRRNRIETKTFESTFFGANECFIILLLLLLLLLLPLLLLSGERNETKLQLPSVRRGHGWSTRNNLSNASIGPHLVKSFTS